MVFANKLYDFHYFKLEQRAYEARASFRKSFKNVIWQRRKRKN